MSYQGRGGPKRGGSNRGRGRGSGRGGSRGRGRGRGDRGGYRGAGRGRGTTHTRGRGGYGHSSGYPQDDYYSSGYYGQEYYGYYDYYGGYYEGYYDNYYTEATSKGPFFKKNQFNFVKDRKKGEGKVQEEKKVKEVKSFVHDEQQVKESLQKVAKGGQLSVMMVAEKPMIAQTIALILSHGSAKKSSGVIKTCPVWEYEGEFKGFKAKFKVTSVAGHMYSRDFPEKVDTWKVDAKSLFGEETIQKPTSKALCKHIQVTGKDVNVLLLWLDCDREGENICFEVIDNLKGTLPYPRENYIFRAKFSSLANKDIISAYESIINKPNEYESQSVEARQIIDLKIGVAFSVFQTLKLTSKYPMIQQVTKTVSYGPCQFPTLGFCIERAERIQKFTPEPFWSILVSVKPTAGDMVRHDLKWKRKHLFDKECCVAIYDEIKEEKEAVVFDVNESSETQNKPLGLNTVKLLKVASSAFGLSAHAAMRVAENLYLSGYISYPRTESTAYSSNFNFNEILQAHKTHSDWGEYVSGLLEEGHEKPRQGNDAGDHPPITPVKCAEKEKLGDLEWRLYQFITQNFLATISKPAKYKVLRVLFKVGPEYFEMKGKQMIQKGFLEITPWLSSAKEVDLPDIQKGAIYQVEDMRLHEGRTSPPGYLTESDLISCMEANCIGTDASIPTHIKNIIDRGYVKVNAKKGRALVPTNLGMALSKAYCEIDSELILPSVRSYIEKSCDRVAKGHLSFQDVVDHVLKIFKQKFEYLEEKFSIVDQYIKKEFVDKFDQEKQKDKDKAKGSDLYKDAIGFLEDVKSYEHCTVFDDFKAVITEKVFHLHCNSCKKGQLKKINPKNKRDTNIYLRCTNCKYEIVCFKDCEKFEIMKDGCEICNSSIIRVNYSVKESPFPLSANQHTGCLHCDEVFHSIVDFPEVKETTEKSEHAEQPADEENKEEAAQAPPKQAAGIVITKKKRKK